MNASMEQRIRSSFARQAALATMGASLVSIQEGEVTIELPFRTDLTQQHGFIHAGIITAVVDTACGYAALTLMPPASAVLSVEYKVNFLCPAQGEKFVARGRVLKPGRTLLVCWGEVHAIQSGHQKLIATMLATMMCRENSDLSD